MNYFCLPSVLIFGEHHFSSIVEVSSPSPTEWCVSLGRVPGKRRCNRRTS